MTFSEILFYFKDAIRAFSSKHLNFSENSFVYALGQAVAAIGVKIFAALTNIEKRTSILEATGEDLDNIFANFKIFRKSAESSRGYLNVWVSTLPTTPITIFSGEEFYDEEGRRFQTQETAVIPSKTIYYPTAITVGSRFYAIPLKNQDEEYNENGTYEQIRQKFLESYNIDAVAAVSGLDGDVEKNTITNSRGGLRANNPVAFTGGAEQENDEQFRLRGLSFLRGANSKFSNNSLKSFLLSQAGVIDANVVEDYGCLSFTPPRSGHIYAIVNTSLVPISEDTSEPYPVSPARNIYQDIRNAIEDEMYRPLGIGITVREADVLNVDFTSDTNNALKIYVKSNVVSSVKEAEIKAKIYSYFLGLNIGDDVRKSDIYGLIKQDEDVIDVDDFTFKSIYGTDTYGNPQYNEVVFLDAACNQVYRVNSSSNLTVIAENIAEENC
jgi:uncharacterized phage protein gp47/JayE